MEKNGDARGEMTAQPRAETRGAPGVKICHVISLKKLQICMGQFAGKLHQIVAMWGMGGYGAGEELVDTLKVKGFN